MQIKDVERIALLSMELDIRPQKLREIEEQQKYILNRAEPIHYYNFLFLLSRVTGASRNVELGTLHGASAWHLGEGHWTGPAVHTIDTDLPVTNTFLKRSSDSFGPNVYIHTGDSLKFKPENYFSTLQIDILFADSVHTYEHILAEYNKYRPYMAKDGVMIFDDIHISPEMERFWEELPDPKVDISFLHSETGFGACIIQ